jgi:hypothetical protein
MSEKAQKSFHSFTDKTLRRGNNEKQPNSSTGRKAKRKQKVKTKTSCQSSLVRLHFLDSNCSPLLLEVVEQQDFTSLIHDSDVKLSPELLPISIL